MKKFDYQPSTSDVETMLTTLTIMTSLLPTLDLEDFDELHKQQNIYYANSAIKRLENLETKKVIKVDDGAVGIEGSSIYLAKDEEITIEDLI